MPGFLAEGKRRLGELLSKVAYAKERVFFRTAKALKQAIAEEGERIDAEAW